MDITVMQSGYRLDKYLAEKTALSRSHVKHLMREGQVLVNGKPQKPKYLVQEGDGIRFEMPKVEPLYYEAEDLPLDIIYEDGDLAIVNKP